MTYPSTAQQLAADLERFASAFADTGIQPEQLEPLMVYATYLLNRHYGIGNHHSMAVTDMFNSATSRANGGMVSVEFLRSVARRLRNIFNAPGDAIS